MPESQLDYWRCDPLLNEHHEHWHIVYPYSGILCKTRHSADEVDEIAAGTKLPKHLIWNSRHGELFVYMHAQLLARYAAERLSLGLPKITPFDDYSSPIAEAYDVDPSLTHGGLAVSPARRTANERWRDIVHPKFSVRAGAKVQHQAAFAHRFRNAVTNPANSNFPLSVNHLGELMEPTARHETQYFGALHNDGHLHFSLRPNTTDNFGAMFYEGAALSDPVFYRWHLHLNEIFSDYQSHLTPHPLDDLPELTIDRFQIVGEGVGDNRIVTEMGTYTRALASGPTPFEFLYHRGFTIRISIRNNTRHLIEAVARIFCAPDEICENRSAWIEIDKFKLSATSGVSPHDRRSSESSVVRRPVIDDQALKGQRPWPSEIGVDPGCKCGWPYTLLVPRGNKNGLKVKFFVILTPGDDMPGQVPGASSYCGAIGGEYPDRRPMGFPFDREVAGGPVSWLLSAGKRLQTADTDVTIVHR